MFAVQAAYNNLRMFCLSDITKNKRVCTCTYSTCKIIVKHTQYTTSKRNFVS